MMSYQQAQYPKTEEKSEMNEAPWDEMYDINIKNSFGNTALHIAASWARLILPPYLKKGPI